MSASEATIEQGVGKGRTYGVDAECSMDDCATRPVSNGLCMKHFARWKRTGSPKGRRIEDAKARFEQYVDRSGECHRWTGVVHYSGYGQFYMDGRWQRVHRVAVILAGTEIPDGMTVDHVKKRGCRHLDCVRLDHLEVVTDRVNILRSDNPCAINARKTHCIRDHEFTPENTIETSRGHRNCRTCINDRARRKRAERSA